MNLNLKCHLDREAYCPLCARPLESDQWTVLEDVAWCRTCARTVDLEMQARIAFLSITSDGLPVFAISDGIRFWCPNTIRAPRLSAHLHAVKYPSAYDPRHPVAEAPAQQDRSADPPIKTP